jgi:hypothetical protein
MDFGSFLEVILSIVDKSTWPTIFPRLPDSQQVSGGTETQPFRQADLPLHGQGLNVQRRDAHLLHGTHTPPTCFFMASTLTRPSVTLPSRKSNEVAAEYPHEYEVAT